MNKPAVQKVTGETDPSSGTALVRRCSGCRSRLQVDTTRCERCVQRSRRKHQTRAKTIDMERASAQSLKAERMLNPGANRRRLPMMRYACESRDRSVPCLFVTCAHNLFLDVDSRSGSIKLNRPELEPDEMPAKYSCALDCADEGGLTLQEVGEALNISREAVRLIQESAFRKCELKAKKVGLEPGFVGAEGIEGDVPESAECK